MYTEVRERLVEVASPTVWVLGIERSSSGGAQVLLIC